jgi:hypothetical protein
MNKEIREFQAKKGIDIESMIFRLMKQYANQRVIDELEYINGLTYITDEIDIREYTDKIIKQLKE